MGTRNPNITNFEEISNKFSTLLILKYLTIILVCLMCTDLHAQRIHSDNGNGTFTNPVIAGDFPDPDVIRVGNMYYMVSTTMFVFPGVTILKSSDLVNWSYCSNAVPEFNYSPCYDLQDCNRYAHGPWATSFKYHDGKYHLLFITLDEGGFTCTATKPEGPWEMKKLPKGFYDPGLFYDDDGRIYVAHGYGKISITEVDKNLAPISKDSLVFTGNIRGGLEGSHVYKINGFYYLYSTYGGANGIQVALRSKNIYGPYEQKVVLNDTTKSINRGMHQGALIQTQTGEWWTMLFVDRGPFGRIPSLQPVQWENGWPMVGVNGKAVITYKKPTVGRSYPVNELPTSDNFTKLTLGMQWGWNHNPDPDNWSLKQRPGYMRLITGNVVSELTMARNTLTQRLLINPDLSKPTIATTKLDITHMKNGDEAGLAVFQIPYAYIAVRHQHNQKYIVMVNNGKTVDSVACNRQTIFLRTTASNTSRKASFTYSFDNKKFKPLGNVMEMQFSLKVFTGNKICLFNFATQTPGGYVDYDYLKLE